MQPLFRSGFNVAVAITALCVGASAFATGTQFDCGSGKAEGRKILRIVGLTEEGSLVCFNAAAPRLAFPIGYVNGLVDDASLVGIDFRVQDGLLYGVGNMGGVYKIDTRSANVTLVNRLTVPLVGDSFGVDFNPAADRLRIVSNTGQNLRHNVNAGGVTIEDGALNYAVGTAATGIVGSAYTNNDLDATTATTLFELDSTLDQISIQSPPNNGSLAPTGKLNIDAVDVAGFDIYSRVSKGVSYDNDAYASINSGFYKINLLTGDAAFLGRVKPGIVDVAVPLNQ